MNMQEQSIRMITEYEPSTNPVLRAMDVMIGMPFVDDVDVYMSQPQGLDYADRMCPPGHEGHRLWVNDFGTVYCMSCVNTGITVGSIADERDAFCQRCDHPNTWHLDGRCLGDCPCK